MEENNLKRLLEANAAETRRHFEITAEGIKHEVRLVADAVAQLDGKVDREIGRLEGQIDRGFADTQAMIKFSRCSYSLCAPSSLLRVLSKVPSGVCPAFLAISSTRQSEKPSEGFRR